MAANLSAPGTSIAIVDDALPEFVDDRAVRGYIHARANYPCCLLLREVLLDV